MLKSQNLFFGIDYTSFPPSQPLPPPEGHPPRALFPCGKSGTAPPGRKGPRGEEIPGRKRYRAFP